MSFMDAMSNVMGDAAPMLGKKKKNFPMPGGEQMPADKPKPKSKGKPMPKSKGKGKPMSKGKSKPMPKGKAKAKPMSKGKKPFPPKNSK